MNNLVGTIIFIGGLLFSPPKAQFLEPLSYSQEEAHLLSQRRLDLTILGQGSVATEILADNIRLNLHYLKGGELPQPKEINWPKIREPFTVTFSLKPGEVFAFHDQVLQQYEGRTIKTQPSHFGNADGYKTLTLPGSGVCYLASLINWAATEAGLEITALANHDFEPVPGVPRQYGTSIFYDGASANSRRQNLYVTNRLSGPVTFHFEVTREEVVLSIYQAD